jgi:conjugative relaxase-like TrwC/TraI family protein
MFKVSNVCIKRAVEYYTQENYYAQGEEAQHNSLWHGSGATVLGLSGAIQDLEKYSNVMKGRSPNDAFDLRQHFNWKENEERAAYDLTFSVPKSMSIRGLVFGEEQLKECLWNATLKTLDWIEERYTACRIKGQKTQSGNLIAACWLHDTNRNHDPQWHIHAVVANATQGPDGQWRRLLNEDFHKHQILIGHFFRQELALECEKEGYKIIAGEQDFFELEGFSREQIEAFSSRRMEILDFVEEHGLENTEENRQLACLRTRQAKQPGIDREELKAYWQWMVNELKIEAPEPPNQRVSQEPVISVSDALEEAVAAGIEHCSEREVAFHREAVEEFIAAEIRPFSLREVSSVLEQHPNIIKAPDGRLTTEQAFHQELRLIQLMQSQKGAVRAIAHVERVEAELDGSGLWREQMEAVKLGATTTDRFMALVGVAGAGKTYSLDEFRRIAELQGYQVQGYATTGPATDRLQDDLGLQCTTVASLLCSSGKKLDEKVIWLVDEAGLLGLKNGVELVEKAIAEDARLVFIYGRGQNSGVSAGNPMESLLQHGMTRAYLNESYRQKDPCLKKAVDLAAMGQIRESIDHLAKTGRIEELKSQEDRVTQIVQAYLSAYEESLKLNPEKQPEILIVSNTHKERLAILAGLRPALKEKGLIGEGVTAIKLQNKDLTTVQSRYTHHFERGDIVVPTRDYPYQGLKKFQPYEVIGKDKDTLTLRSSTGEELTVEPMAFRKTVYAQQKMEVAVGDRLRWSTKEKVLGHRTGEEFIVTAIEGRIATVQYQKGGRIEQLNLDEKQYFDYAWVSTNLKAQGATADCVLFSSTVDRTVGKENFYTAISRARYLLKIFAEDLQFLKEKAVISRRKENPLELLEPKEKQEVATAGETQTGKINRIQPNHQQENSHARYTGQSESTLSHNHPADRQRRDSPAPRKPSRSPGRDSRSFESGLEQLSAAISGHVEETEIERIGNAIEAIYRKFEQDQLSATELANLHHGLEQLHSAIHHRLEQRGRGDIPGVRALAPERERIADLLATAIIDYQYEQSIADIIPALEGLLENLQLPEMTELTAKLQQFQQVMTHQLEQQAVQSLLVRTESPRVVDDSTVQEVNQEVNTRPRLKPNPVSLRKQSARDELKELAEQLRQLPLEEIAERLGLERDRRDKKKWKADGYNISINDSKFFDHYAQTGGHGAIDLVMHVNQCDFKQAVHWLGGDNVHSLPRVPTLHQQISDQSHIERKDSEKAPSCNIRDESKWHEIKNYLVQKRGLPEDLVEQLHCQGLISADWRRNVMFFRYELRDNFERGAAIGANLRGTQGTFKGLTTGTHRNEGYFWFQAGEGEIKRVVLTESPIDAMSLAALEGDSRSATDKVNRQQQETIYLSADGAGEIPTMALKGILEREGEVVVAFDNDQAGEEMSWKVAQKVPGVKRMTPKHGKDWNERLVGKEQDDAIELNDLHQWSRIAQALGRPQAYRDNVQVVVKAVASGETMSEAARTAFEQDRKEFRGTLDQLQAWHFGAHQLGKDSAYLQQIAEIAIAFNARKNPTPLSDEGRTQMQGDLAQWSKVRAEQKTIALAAANLLHTIGEPHLEGKVFEGNSLRFVWDGSSVIVSSKRDEREIVRMTQGVVVKFKPQADELQKLRQLVKDFPVQTQQQSQQRSRGARLQ